MKSNLDLSEFEGFDLLYIRLHGLPGQPFLYGDPGWPTALAKDQVLQMKLAGTEVFLEGCYGAGFANAFLRAGASVVIGSDQSTFGKRLFLGPSSTVGAKYLILRKRGITPKKALSKSLKQLDQKYQIGWRLFDEI